ncbi:MAG: hypothetical protein MK194_10705 [Roseibacillus sp.]|jgi:hypothetical protein|nr:hypothetical protein [Roseibacillus sp.]
MRSLIPLSATLLLTGISGGDPSFRIFDQSFLEVSWDSSSNKQYELWVSSDLVNWVPAGPRQLGVDGRLSLVQDISGRDKAFFRVEEFGGFQLDLNRFNFGRVGSKWSYDVVEAGIGGTERYTWESEIEGRTVFRGKDVIEWNFYRDDIWDQTIYILDDFSSGIYEVGGVASGQGEQWNDPPLPSLFENFDPGVVIPHNYQSSVLGSVTDRITITPDTEPLTVPAGTFTGLLKVEHRYNGVVQGGFAVTGVTTEWFAPDVGMVKHEGEVTLAGFVATTEFALRSYEVN